MAPRTFGHARGSEVGDVVVDHVLGCRVDGDQVHLPDWVQLDRSVCRPEGFEALPPLLVPGLLLPAVLCLGLFAFGIHAALGPGTFQLGDFVLLLGTRFVRIRRGTPEPPVHEGLERARQ